MSKLTSAAKGLFAKAINESSDPTYNGDTKKGKAEEGWSIGDLMWLDSFPYLPSYKYHAYRSTTGAVCSFCLIGIFVLRFGYTTSDFVALPPIVTESRQPFPRDDPEQYNAPNIGILFKKDGWKPFNDPTYFTIQFHQGQISRSGYINYTNVGASLCNFVDADGRLIAEDARCPVNQALLQGDYYDEEFQFVRGRIVRCDNGTDVEGKPLPGVCMMPQAIDDLIFSGTFSLYVKQVDMKPTDLVEQTKILSFRREFIYGVHLAIDMFFTVMRLEQRPRYQFDETVIRFLTLFDSKQESYTNFDEQKKTICCRLLSTGSRNDSSTQRKNFPVQTF